MSEVYLVSVINENYFPFTAKFVSMDKDEATKEFLKELRNFSEVWATECEDDINLEMLNDIEQVNEAFVNSSYIDRLSNRDGMTGVDTGLLYGFEDTDSNVVMLHKIRLS